MHGATSEISGVDSVV